MFRPGCVLLVVRNESEGYQELLGDSCKPCTPLLFLDVAVTTTVTINVDELEKMLFKSSNHSSSD